MAGRIWAEPTQNYFYHFMLRATFFASTLVIMKKQFINNQANDTKKKSILRIETLHNGGKFVHGSTRVQCPNFRARGLVTSKVT